MPLIYIKVDCVASLRNIRQLKEPDPSHAAVLAELAGADGICCHLREDRVHIRDRDLYILKEVVKTGLTLQIAPAEDLVERALEVKPPMVTLVPFATEEPTALKGVDLRNDDGRYSETAATLKENGIRVGLFAEADSEAMKDAARARVDAVELNALDYVKASAEGIKDELDRLEQMAQLAGKLGMAVTCGNGLNYKNIGALVDLDVFEGFTIGYAVISRALMIGFERAVGEIIGLVHLK